MVIAQHREHNTTAGVTPTTARDTQWYTEQRPLPTMHQPYQFLKARTRLWGSAADVLNWDEAEKLAPKVHYVDYHDRVPIIGRETWPRELERTV
eukprot:11967084-Prorocentrum_lima.AAC.1